MEFEISKLNMARYNCLLSNKRASANMEKKMQIKQLGDAFY